MQSYSVKGDELLQHVTPERLEKKRNDYCLCEKELEAKSWRSSKPSGKEKEKSSRMKLNGKQSYNKRL
jgi:hypothetical protein